jgi:superfamily II DNA or RNA helicase
MIQLREWQKSAIDALLKQSGGGIVEAATGSGKTIVALELIRRNPNSRFLIVVPTIVLQGQWRDEILKLGLATEEEISRIGGGHKDVPATRITISVINSLRTINWNHELAIFDYLVCDEVHRYGSLKNMRFLRKDNFGFKLGLTATLERSDNAEDTLIQLIGPVVYRLTNKDAVNLDYVSKYDVITVDCEFTPEELIAYQTATYQVSELQSKVGTFDNALKMIASRRGMDYQSALKYVKAVQNRKQCITKILCKRDMAVLLAAYHREEKVILFDEVQESANDIYAILHQLLGDKVVLYHSGMKAKDKSESIRRYKEGDANILVSVRALDEGLDVKSANIGIIVNGNSQKRQALQRLGRILRKEEDKVATLYMFYINKTIDKGYMTKRLKYLDAVNSITDIFWSDMANKIEKEDGETHGKSLHALRQVRGSLYKESK